MRAPAIPTRDSSMSSEGNGNGNGDASGTGSGIARGSQPPRRRARKAALLAAVFAVGALGGGAVVMSTDAWSHWGRWGGPMGHHGGPERWKGHMEDHALFWLDRVDATDEQREAVRTIVGEAFDDLSDVVGEHRTLRREWLAELERAGARCRGAGGPPGAARGAARPEEPEGPRRARRGRLGADRGAARRARFDALMASGPAGRAAARVGRRLIGPDRGWGPASRAGRRAASVPKMRRKPVAIGAQRAGARRTAPEGGISRRRALSFGGVPRACGRLAYPRVV